MDTTQDPLRSVKERLTSAETDNLNRFTFKDLEFVVNRGVFPPTHFQSTTIFTEEIPYPKGGTLWEVGCGAGVTAVVAALTGCAKVLASDISAEAVENAILNVRKYSVDRIVSVRRGDLFDVLELGETFDVIYWNSNFVYVPENYHFERNIYRAFADAGYRTHARFFKEAPKYLTKQGKILLGFSSQGDRGEIERMVSAYDYAHRTIASRYSAGTANYRYDILELTPR